MILRHCWQPLFQFFLSIPFLLLVSAADETKIKLGNTTIERTVQLRTHSIFAPYIDQDLQNRWWDFGGDAYINTNKHIRLTQNRPSQTGWLWSRLPLTSSNWVMEVEFKVSGHTTHLFGDGLAVWITKDRAEVGPAFGNQNPFNGVGVFLDTYANARHSYAFPRIMAVQGDGVGKYDIDSDGDGQSLGACSANFRQTNVPTKLKISYVKDKFLDVKLQYKAYDEWLNCFTVNQISLPASPYIGFTANTGDVSDAHDIISISTHSAILSKEDTPRDSLKASASGSFFGSLFSFLFKFAIFAAIAGGLYYGYQVYQSRQAYSGAGNFGGPPSMARYPSSGPVSYGGYGGGPGVGGGYGGAPGGAYGGGGMYDSKRAY